VWVGFVQASVRSLLIMMLLDLVHSGSSVVCVRGRVEPQCVMCLVCMFFGDLRFCYREFVMLVNSSFVSTLLEEM
jgi:hypothetical protein